MSDLSQYSHLIARDKQGNRIANPVMQRLNSSSKVKKKEEYIEPYRGEIPSIIGMVLMLVKANAKECFVFARKDNANIIREKHGNNFKRFLGVVTHEPYPRPKPKASYNYWEAVYDDFDIAQEHFSIEDLIVAQELRGESKLDIQEEETEYNPYSDQPSEEEDGEDNEEGLKVEDPDKITPGNFNEKIRNIIAQRLNERETKFFELWRRGTLRANIKKELFMTDSAFWQIKTMLFKKIGAAYGAKSTTEFTAIITDIGNAYQSYLADRERKKLMSGGRISKDSALLRELSDKEKEVLRLMKMKMTGSAIANKLQITPNAISGFRKRIIDKIGINLFTQVVKRQVKFEDDFFNPAKHEIERKEVTEEEVISFRSGIRFDTNQDFIEAEEEQTERIGEVEEIEEPVRVDGSHLEVLLSVFKGEMEEEGDLEEAFTREESPAFYAVNNGGSLLVNVDNKPELTEVNVYNNAIEDDNNTDEEDYKIMSSIMSAPLPPSFKEFISLYKNSRDAAKAEEQFNKLSEADKVSLVADVPGYLKSVSNPAYIKSPLAYITGKSWLKKV